MPGFGGGNTVLADKGSHFYICVRVVDVSKSFDCMKHDKYCPRCGGRVV